MDVNAFEVKLEKRLASLLMEDKTITAGCFNSGLRTMYNYAIVAAYELKDEAEKEAV